MQVKDTKITTKQCAMCGKLFDYSSGRAAKYCSDKCRFDAKYERQKQEQFMSEKRSNKQKRGLTYADMLKERELNKSYAERQKAKTLEMYGRITIPTEKN